MAPILFHKLGPNSIEKRGIYFPKLYWALGGSSPTKHVWMNVVYIVLYHHDPFPIKRSLQMASFLPSFISNDAFGPNALL